MSFIQMCSARSLVCTALALASCASSLSAEVTFGQATGRYRYQGVLGAEADVLQWNEEFPFAVIGPAFPGPLGGGFNGIYENTGTTLANGDFGIAISQNVRMNVVTSFASAQGFQVDVDSAADVDEIYSFGPAGGGGSVSANLLYEFSVDTPITFTLTYEGVFEGIENALRLERENNSHIVWTFLQPAGFQSATHTGTLLPGGYRLRVTQAAQGNLPFDGYTLARLTVGTIPTPGASGLLALAALAACRRRR